MIGRLIPGVEVDGCAVYCSPDVPCKVPRIQLTAELPYLTQSARDNMNAYLLETFGVHCGTYKAYGNLYLCMCAEKLLTIEGEDRELTTEAEDDRAEFEAYYADQGCSCCISPPCGYCVHPGNPRNQEEDDSAWVSAIPMSLETITERINALSNGLASAEKRS